MKGVRYDNNKKITKQLELTLAKIFEITAAGTEMTLFFPIFRQQ
jgi:hypothetical protein